MLAEIALIKKVIRLQSFTNNCFCCY